MSQFIVLLEILIFTAYLKEIVLSSNDNIFMVIIILIGYLCLKVTYYIFQKHKRSIILLVLICLSSLVVGLHFYVPILYYLGLTTYQLMDRLNPKFNLYTFFILTLLVFIDLNFAETFVIVNIFSICLIHRDTIAIKKSNDLLSRLDKLKDDIGHVKQDLLYQSQIDQSYIVNSRLEERNEIAQKLHDQLGHTLSGSTMQLEAALMILDSNGDQSKEIVQRVIHNLRQGTDEIRKILKEIKPTTANMSIQTLRALLDDTESKTDIKMNLVYDSNVIDIGYKSWQIIINNTKEAITNMIKHSNATKCLIQFERMNKMYKILIHDNGQGKTLIKKSIGLQGMEERLSSINGQLVVDGSNGFSIIMLIPIERKDNVN